MGFDRNGYVTTEEMRRKGFVRREDGTIYKRNALEMIYEETGWLKNHFKGKMTAEQEKFESLFNALNRFTAGQRLIHDRYKAGFETCKANDIRKIRVDGSGSFLRPEYMDDAESRYVAAMRAIPHKYRKVVSALFEDEVVLSACHAGELRKGLDSLIEHYLKLSMILF